MFDQTPRLVLLLLLLFVNLGFQTLNMGFLSFKKINKV